MATNEDERPTFYEEQYLGADDLNSAVGYGRAQLARHSLGAHTWGIAAGLELVEKDVPGLSGQVDVYLTPGYAWDGFGRVISATAPSKLPPELFMNFRFDPSVDGDGKGRKIEVWLRYWEENTQSEGEAYAPCDTPGRNLRTLETFQFVIGPQSAPESQVLVDSQPVDAEMAVQKFNPAGSLLKDHSVSFQDWPSDEVKAVWLIPVGYVLWLPVQGNPGFFVPSKDNSDIKAGTKTFRRYAGVVAGQVEAASGIIRLHDRGKAYSIYNSDELVWVEGDLRVEGDVRPFGTALDFRNGEGKRDTDMEMLLRRVDDPGKSSALQLVIGHAKDGNNSLSVGPLDSDTFQPKLTVLDNGNIGVGTTPPAGKVTIKGDLPEHGLLSIFSPTSDIEYDGGNDGLFIFRDMGGKTAFMGGNIGFGTATPVGKLTIQGELAAHGLLSFFSPTSDIEYDGGSDGLFIFRDMGGRTAFMGGNIGIGTADPKAKLHVSGGAIMPTAGNTANSGIQFPSDPGGGLGDEAFIRYYAEAGETTKLLIGVGNDPEDTIGFQQAGAERMTISNSNVGIGIRIPSAKLEVFGNGGQSVDFLVNGRLRSNNNDGGLWITSDRFVGGHSGDKIGFFSNGAWQLTVQSNGSVGIGTMTPDSNYKLDVAGEAISPNFFSTSDARLKKNIAPLTDVLKRLSNVNGVSYEWNETYEALGRASKKREIGIIAQDVQKVFPELVSTWNAENYLAVDYGRLTAVLVEAVKELNAKIEALQERLSKLETQPRPTQRKTKDKHPGKEEST
jgi:hypothetical protein